MIIFRIHGSSIVNWMQLPKHSPNPVNTASPHKPEDREILASEQATLISALHGIGQLPAGFDADHLKLAAASLARKRFRAVQKTWPATAAALGNQFWEVSRSYCDQHPAPPENPFEDGYQFVQWLERKRMLPPKGRVELACHRVTGSGLPRILYDSANRELLILLRMRDAVRRFRLKLSLNPARLFKREPRQPRV